MNPSSMTAANSVSTLFVSVTNRCNLDCSYCSANAGPYGSATLPIETATAKVAEWIGGASRNSLTMIITGGEPTLWGYTALNRLCREARQQADQRAIQLKIGLQSNGTRIDNDFIKFCHTWHVEPCFSHDGTPEINDLHRGGSHKVVEALKTLAREGIDFALIACLTQHLANGIDNALDWYAGNGFRKIRINSLGAVQHAEISSYPDSSQIASAWQKIIEHMDRFPETGVRELNCLQRLEYFSRAQQGKSGKTGCHKSRCFCGEGLAAVNPDGSYCLCVERSMSRPLPLAKDLVELQQQALRFWGTFNGWEICRNCAAMPICDQGCVAYHRMDHRLFEPECTANKRLWEFFQQRSATSLYSAGKPPRQTQPPSAIVAAPTGGFLSSD